MSRLRSSSCAEPGMTNAPLEISPEEFAALAEPADGPSMFLIDTDILIYSLKADEVVLSHLRRTAASAKAISVISYGELLYGAQKSARPDENLARVRRLGEVLPVIPVSPAIMETFSALKARLESDGRRLDDFELVIAATALTVGYRLVTNNEKHYRRIHGLHLETWTQA